MLIRYREDHVELGSTNDRAIELAQATDLELPALVVARLQTAGRGRGDRSWWSSEGALTFSLVLEAESASPCRTPLVPLVVGVAVCDAVEDLSDASPMLKWPNDVVVTEPWRKLAGILIEVPAQPPGRPRRAVIGVGINVCNRIEDAPETIRRAATSLRHLGGVDLTTTDVLDAFLRALGTRWDQFRRGDPVVIDAWRNRDGLAGRDVVVESGAGRIAGRCDGIDADGALRVATKDGLQRVLSGTVEFSGIREPRA